MHTRSRGAVDVRIPTESLAVRSGTWSAGVGVSNSLGPPLAGLLIAAGGWRWVFLAGVPIAVLAAAATRKLVDTGTDRFASMPDPIGSLLVIVGVAPLVYAVVRGSTWGWLDARTLGLAAVGVAVLAIFIVRCERNPNPLIDLRMFRLPMFGAGIAGGFAMTATWFCTYWGLVLYVTSAWNWSAIHAGLATAPVPLLAGITGMSVNQIATRTGLRAVIFVGAGLLVLTSATIWLTIGDTPSNIAVFASSILMGIGSGCVLTPFWTAAVLYVPPPQHATATGVNFMSLRLANTLGVAVAITFFAQSSTLQSLHRCLVVTALGAVVVAAFGFAFVYARAPPRSEHKTLHG